ncbi:tail fiber protein [Marinomonas sp. SBI22]|uniref:phage tail-collar fiber domain-containing protein n=1 Tax=unclassified Marinomonas TaxID=196814 RepID=UPI0007AF2E24|nr:MULTISPECIES: phage tail protein [unclassified Marinomonas]KZM40951.1 tail fiber protein [Marinomonas sp. SBI22]KZM42791.1 tail fiber protein [Marinomonas sp. SBI8L]
MTDIISGTVTDAGARYIAQKAASLEPVVVTHFILANVPGVDETTPADPSMGIPTEYLIDDFVAVQDPHYNDDNAVTYSLVLDSSVGDYDFNYYGIVTDSGELLAYSYIPLNKKRKDIGQVINRNLVVPFSNAKQLTGADLPLESWQFDYEAEMLAMQTCIMQNSAATISALSSAIKNHERLLTLEGKL